MTVLVRTNLPDFRAQLDATGPKLGRRVLRYATAGAAQVIRNRARQLAPSRKTGSGSIFRSKQGDRIPGLLKRSIISPRNAKGSSRSLEAYFVTVRAGVAPTKGGVSRDAYYWRWVEGGHIKRQPGGPLRGGVARKKLARTRARAGGSWVAGRWYLQSAGQQSFSAALTEFYRRAEQKIALLSDDRAK